MAPSPTDPPLLSIGAVERDTGLGKDTLRVWERRYGFPQPGRDARGERMYPMDQVEKLRIIRRLLDLGLRPNKIVARSIAELHELSGRIQTTRQPGTKPPVEEADEISQTAQSETLNDLMNLIQQHQVEALRQRLAEHIFHLGLDQFIRQIAAPLVHRVGDAWALGQLAIFEEHLFSESLNQVLRQAICTIPSPNTGASPPRPSILLTTFPQESHGLGLLMAEAMFTMAGARCISLGVQTPIVDIAEAAQCQNCNIVALSFSTSLNGNVVLSGLEELRQQMPSHIEIWAGGSNPILQRRPPKGIEVLTNLDSIPTILDRWRASQAS
jgi:DNA-binding transcriptional MerR regulator/methylmalonyl-CoA mutase cobalamin-binding subunit